MNSSASNCLVSPSNHAFSSNKGLIFYTFCLFLIIFTLFIYLTLGAGRILAFECSPYPECDTLNPYGPNFCTPTGVSNWTYQCAQGDGFCDAFVVGEDPAVHNCSQKPECSACQQVYPQGYYEGYYQGYYQGTYESYSCPGGTRCDGSPVTGGPLETVCGTDLQYWTCTQDGWQASGTSCSCGGYPQGYYQGGYPQEGYYQGGYQGYYQGYYQGTYCTDSAPTAPPLVSPANGAQFPVVSPQGSGASPLPLVNQLIDWSPPSWGTDCGGDPNYYQLRLEINDSTPDTLVYQDSTSSYSTDSNDVPQTGTYYWRVRANNGALYGPYSSTRDFNVVWAQDLKVRFVNTDAPQSYKIGETVNLTARVTNIGGVASSATTLGVWEDGSPFPSCPGSAVDPTASGGQSFSVPVLNPGQSTDITGISFTVNTPGSFTAQAYVVPVCNQTDRYWPNNATNGTLWFGSDGAPGGTGDNADDSDGPGGLGGTLPGGFTYVVFQHAWFETLGGDIGAQNGDIAVSQAPPANRYLSSYLGAASGNLNTSQIKPTGWSIANYSGHNLVPPGSVYQYMAERFLAAAKENTVANNIPSGGGPGLNYVEGDGDFNVGNGPNGAGVVYFIHGNLNIHKDLTLAAGDSSIFIVSGDINVDTSVKELDGIYIAGGIFKDIDSAGGIGGPQLVVRGAVYAHTVDLARSLTPSGCGVAPCDNTVHPAEQFVFDPAYIDVLSTIIGSPSVVWAEVAP